LGCICDGITLVKPDWRATGVLLAVGEHWIEGYSGQVNSTGTVYMAFQRSNGTSKVSIMAYRYAGGER
jgi:hypothetical protein